MRLATLEDLKPKSDSKIKFLKIHLLSVLIILIFKKARGRHFNEFSIDRREVFQLRH